MPVTVNEALKKGNAMLNYASGAIFFVFIGGGFVLSNLYPKFSAVMIVGGIVLGILLCLLYWCLQANKWKIWAYENVDNIHELKQRAIDSKLMYDDDSFWNKLIITSAADKQRLAALQDRFNQKDVYTDDVTVPTETLIYFSKPASMFNMFLGLVMLGFGIYLYTNHSLVPAGFLGLFGAFLLYSGFKEYTNTKPQIILNANGIQTAKTELQDWKEITDERVYVESSGKSSTTYFTYDYPGGTEKVNIGDLAIDAEPLRNLLHVYRLRSEKRRGGI